MRRLHGLASLVLTIAFPFALAAPAAQPSAEAWTPLDLRQVKLGGELGRRIEITVKNNLLVANIDKDFLAPFLQKKQHGGYIGLGKTIDATVRFAAYAGDEKVTALKNRLVDQVVQAQEPDGYIGLCAPPDRMHGLWDVHEIGYLVWGLMVDYQYFGEKRSLEAARKASDYMLAHWSAVPKDWGQRTGVATNVAVTGLERTMLALYRHTGDRRYLDFCLQQRALAQWDLPIVIGRRPGIEGHIYAYMSRCLAQLELYRLRPEDRLLGQTQRAMDFLTRRNGLAITGGAGQWEIWTDDQDVRGELGETCATAYQIRVYDSLLRLRGDPRYGDLMERTIYNALLAAQSPDGRRLRYFSPLEGPRDYFPGDTYCCPCNFRRIIAELPGFVYYLARGGVAVNLYAPSQVKVDMEGGATASLRQETDYPNSGRVLIYVDPSKPVRFSLRLRIPNWARSSDIPPAEKGGQLGPPIGKVQVAVNGQPIEIGETAASTFEITRQWTSGDKVSLELPMKWRLVRGRQRQAGRVAVMRGPTVFCLNPRLNKGLETQDGADLGRITLDPASLRAVPDGTVRPGGIACRAQAWKPGYGTEPKGDLDLLLTEFPDPEGKAAYFRLRDMGAAVDDELLSGSQ